MPASDRDTDDAGASRPWAAQVVVRSDEALTAEIDGEVVALDVAKGVCYGLDPIGSHIWALLATPIRVAEICAAMAEAYEVDDAVCERDVTDLVADLASQGLVRLLPAA